MADSRMPKYSVKKEMQWKDGLKLCTGCAALHCTASLESVSGVEPFPVIIILDVYWYMIVKLGNASRKYYGHPRHPRHPPGESMNDTYQRTRRYGEAGYHPMYRPYSSFSSFWMSTPEPKITILQAFSEKVSDFSIKRIKSNIDITLFSTMATQFILHSSHKQEVRRSKKQQATSNKQQAQHSTAQATSNKQQATSNKQQATSNKHQATSIKHQASSIKHQAIQKILPSSITSLLLPVSFLTILKSDKEHPDLKKINCHLYPCSN
ncbi:predicted protein [Sclerotinia sclerotiorum 1980 UF-70]|uniref:Uncharacterized protein n=1 Tax=Sclerotinia sclerotiorum (strain ATCC 18683 / 1980 / Ss-1) TaxID=665079 RepID=A7F9J2_SCLS1|nr:predicted protein [Sclerotinia sclerotiorum 1980 UF-70]EDO00403.1 predicted protein [Sclerotinia sclerotiorum 1980 UF-70]